MTTKNATVLKALASMFLLVAPSLAIAQGPPGTTPSPAPAATPAAPAASAGPVVPAGASAGAAPASENRGSAPVAGSAEQKGAAAVREGQQTLPPGPPANSGWPMLVIMLGVLVFMILMTTLTGRKERKRRAELLSGLATNDRVQTIGGVLGTIVEVRDDEVVLRVDENTNTRIRFSKSAVQQVIRKANAGGGAGGAGDFIAEAKGSAKSRATA